MDYVSRTAKARKVSVVIALLAILGLTVVGCGGSKTSSSASNSTTKKLELSGTIKIDGSGTVLPISEAMAEEFMKENPNIIITVGGSGTVAGFKKFTAGKTDISDASRLIQATEMADAEKNGIEYMEIPVGKDGVSIIVSKSNTWAKSITTEELKRIWEPGSTINNWKQIRADWPDQKLVLYGPSSAHGTFDYFTETINGKEKAIRTDYNVCEDYNVVGQGVEGNKGALGFLGYAYYKQNESELGLLAVDGGTGPVKPSEQTINDGTYKPLSRPLLIYLNKKALDRPEVKAFVEFYLTNSELVSKAGYFPLNKKDYDKSLKEIK